MDPGTRDAYERHARELAARDARVGSPLARYLHVAFPSFSSASPKILDVGAGSGRELAFMVSEKFEAYGVEPSNGLRDEAVSRHPELADRIHAGELPGLVGTPRGAYDGVVCSAVLQHIPRQRLFDAVLDLRDVLKPQGRALIAIPDGRPGLDANGRDELGRLFNQVSADELELLFERVGFVRIDRWSNDDALGRAGFTWTTLLLQKSTFAGARPIDQLATVISPREKKVATYKLALLRALAEIGMTQPHRVRYPGGERVAVPLRAISERWVLYYWPLFAAPKFLPQQNGEWSKKRHVLGFAHQLEAVIAHYGNFGLDAYIYESRTGLEGEAREVNERLLRALDKTIEKGPVTYAGGALGKRIFEMSGRDVLVPMGIWRELNLLGPWIVDSIMLRWAELTARLSSDDLSVADVIDHLAPHQPDDRDTTLVRDALLRSKQPLRCVWSGRDLRPQELDVDHVLPWSLWHNNDLWNLVPSWSRVNHDKSDGLPGRAVLRERREAFIDAWQITNQAAPNRFRREASMQVGRELGERVNWLDELFDVMTEAVESTRLQRGLEPWVPRVG